MNWNLQSFRFRKKDDLLYVIEYIMLCFWNWLFNTHL